MIIAILACIAGISLLCNSACGYLIYKMYKCNEGQSNRIQQLTEKLTTVTSDFASMRVKHGQAWEAFVPLMETFENKLGPKCNAVFLGQPIDLIYFNDDEIVFVEVKTGNSRLSNRQRNVRNLVKDRKIRWEEVNDSLKFVLQATDPINLVDTTKTELSQEPSNKPLEIPSES